MMTGVHANSIAPLNQPTRSINKLITFYYITLAIRIALEIAQSPLQIIKKLVGFLNEVKTIYIASCVSYRIREFSYHINNSYPSNYLYNCNIRYNEF